MIANDVVTVTVTVSVKPATAFTIFTEETDLWWRKGPRFRIAGKQPGTLRFEPRVGGRLLEEVESPSGIRTFIKGRISLWQPPERFEFDWWGVNFAEGESTHVQILFEEISSGTRVTLRHSGWAALRPDHPVRHGLQGRDFIRMIGLWWGELLNSLREFAVTKS
jgi:uncharacterized protein YndB with AHSA1/START domain